MTTQQLVYRLNSIADDLQPQMPNTAEVLRDTAKKVKEEWGETDWIKLSTRKPTEADADENDQVRVRYYNSSCGKVIVVERKLDNLPDNATHWHALPKFTEDKYEDEQAFSEWFDPYDKIADLDLSKFQCCRSLAKKSWNKALEYARKK